MIPAPIYELLPFLYTILGLGAIFHFYGTATQGLGIFSGMVMLLAAYFIYDLRCANRKYPSSKRSKK